MIAQWFDSAAALLIAASWQAGLLVILVLVAGRVFRRLSARWRCLLWMVVLVRLLLPVVPPSPMSVVNVARLPAAAAESVTAIESPAATEPADAAQAVAALPLEMTTERAMPAGAPAAELPTAAAPVVAETRSEPSAMSLMGVLLAVWALGVVLLTARGALGLLALRRVLRQCRRVGEPSLLAILELCRGQMAVGTRVELLATDVALAPALAGAFRPRILLSEKTLRSLTEDELCWLLLHELAHVRRRDIVVGWIWWWARTLHWFNPMVWWAAARMRLDAELACDELVLARAVDADRTRYGSTLVRVAELLAAPRPVPGTIGALVREPALSQRVKSILRGRRRSRLWTAVALALVIGLASVGLTGAVEKTSDDTSATAGASPPAQENEATPDSKHGPEAAESSGRQIGSITFTWDIVKTFDHFGPTFDKVFAEGEEGAWDDILDAFKQDEAGPRIDLRGELIAHLADRVVVLSDECKTIKAKQLPFSPLAVKLRRDKPRDRSHLFLHEDGRLTVMLDKTPLAEDPGPMSTVSGNVLLAVKIMRGKSGNVIAGLEKLFDGDPAIQRREFAQWPIWQCSENEDDEADWLWNGSCLAVAHGHLLIATSYDFLVDILRRTDTPGPIRRALLVKGNSQPKAGERANATATPPLAPPAGKRRVRLAPRGVQPVEVDYRHDPKSGLQVVVVDGGVRGTVEETSRDGKTEDVQFEADRVVVRTTAPGQFDVSSTPELDTDVPLELLLQGNVVILHRQGGRVAQQIRAERIYFDARRKSIKAEDGGTVLPLAEYLKRPLAKTKSGQAAADVAARTIATKNTKNTKNRRMVIRVVGPDGRPLPDAHIYANVCLKGTSRVLRPKGLTNAQGEFPITWSGEHDLIRVWASKAGHVPLFTQWWPKYQPDGDDVPEMFNFRLRKGTTVGGVVKDAQGRPISGVKVSVSMRLPSDGSNVQTELRQRPCISHTLAHGEREPNAARTTDADGRWTLDNVPAGDDVELNVAYRHPDYVDRGNYNRAKGRYDATMQSLRDQTCSIVMKKGITVTGRVTDPEGRPVAGAVVVWGDEPYGRDANPKIRTDEHGVYRFPPRLVEPMKGRLTNPDGTPRAGGNITYGDDELGNREATADADGYYEIPAPPVPITVIAQGWAPAMKKLPLKPEDAPREAFLDFQLTRGKTLRVRFVDREDKPVPGVDVTLDGWRGGKSLYNNRHPSVLDTKIPTRADKQGVYEWSWAPSDKVYYNVSKPGYRTDHYLLEPTEEEHVVTMVPVLVLSGKVTDAETGKPISVFRVTPCSTADAPERRPDGLGSQVARDGAYRFTLDRHMPHVSVYVEADGYQPAQSLLFSTANKKITFDAQLRRLPK